MTTGGRGIDAERARRRGGRGAAERERLDRRRRGDARSAARRRRLVSGARSPRSRNLRDGRHPVSVNTQINRLCDAAICRRCSRRDRGSARTPGRSSSRCAMGRAADEPEVLLQPYDLLELFPLLARLKRRCDEARRAAAGRATTSATSARTSGCCAGTMPRGHMALVRRRAARRSASRPTARSRAAPRCRPSRGPAATSATRRLQDIWERAAPLRYTRDRTVDDLWGYCRTCYYADVCRAGCTWTAFVPVRQGGQQPLLPPPRARDAAPGHARAPRAGRARARRAVRPRAVRDRRRGDRS